MSRYVTVQKFDYSGAAWHGGTPSEQGYRVLPLPSLRRPNSKANEYYVYQNESEYKAVEAESAASAVIASKINSPHKILHANAKIDDLVVTQKLECIGSDATYMDKKMKTGIV
jgi:hypothetical protein